MTVLVRVGEEKCNKNGITMKVIAYRRFDDVDIEFENGYVAKNVEYVQFKRGTVKNLYVPSVYTYGYLGEGKYKVSVNGKHTRQYIAWKSMLNRCYGKEFHEKAPTYTECEVEKEWHNFQNFSNWYDENYYEVGEEKMNLDKDILTRGNKIYSPSTCMYVPQSINKLFTKRFNLRGNTPIGVNISKNKKKYESWCSGVAKSGYLGSFDSPEQAFNKYKEYKESLIKQIANKYHDKIPQKLYNVLMNYEINIKD